MHSSPIARLVAIAGAALSLSACNALMSPQPLFNEADTAGAPRLKAGVWSDDGCTPQLLRAHAFPCALRYEVTARTVRMSFDDTALGMKPTKAEPTDSREARARKEADAPKRYLLAAGDPPIMQIDFDFGKESGSAKYYVYYAIESGARDRDGRVVEAVIWPVLCGPPAKPKPDKPKTDESKPDDDAPQPGGEGSNDFPPPTDEPFPGVVVTGGGCSTDDRQVVIGAARLSRQIEAQGLPMNRPGGEHVRWIAGRLP
jgi:hypothetical protein